MLCPHHEFRTYSDETKKYLVGYNRNGLQSIINSCVLSLLCYTNSDKTLGEHANIIYKHKNILIQLDKTTAAPTY